MDLIVQLGLIGVVGVVLGSAALAHHLIATHRARKRWEAEAKARESLMEHYTVIRDGKPVEMVRPRAPIYGTHRKGGPIYGDPL